MKIVSNHLSKLLIGMLLTASFINAETTPESSSFKKFCVDTSKSLLVAPMSLSAAYIIAKLGEPSLQEFPSIALASGILAACVALTTENEECPTSSNNTLYGELYSNRVDPKILADRSNVERGQRNS